MGGTAIPPLNERFSSDDWRSYPQIPPKTLKYTEPTSADNVRATLDNTSAIIEYFVGDGFIAQWLIRKDAVRVNVIKDPKPLLKRVEAYQETITRTNRQLNPEEGLRLYTALLAPFERELEGVTQLMIVPDGELCKLPFQALVFDIINKTPQFLVEKYPISYVQSSSLLISLAERPRPGARRKILFAMGRPLYSRLPIRSTGSRSASEMDAVAKRLPEITADLYSYYLGDRTLDDRPATEEEVDRIGAILNSSGDIFKREQATESRVKEYSNSGILKEFKYLHFATHGLVSDEIPALTSVVLAQDKARQDDGFLTVGEVYGLDLDSDLVTLSACGLGLGKMEKGEGLIGLTRAFMYAGTSAVAVSLWSVSDIATAVLMEDFYKNLAAGMSKDRALQQAQISMIHQARTRADAAEGKLLRDHPFYWAPFVLYGASK